MSGVAQGSLGVSQGNGNGEGAYLPVTDFPNVLRARAVGLLLNARTMAGIRVDSSRAIPLTDADTPRILVYLDKRHYDAKGDDAPQFTALATLTIAGIIDGARLADVEADSDLIADQMLNALMGSAAFLAWPVEKITSIDIDVTIRADSDRYRGVASVQLMVQWTETFPPSITLPGTKLAEIDLTEALGGVAQGSLGGSQGNGNEGGAPAGAPPVTAIITIPQT